MVTNGINPDRKTNDLFYYTALYGSSLSVLNIKFEVYRVLISVTQRVKVHVVSLISNQEEAVFPPDVKRVLSSFLKN